MRRHASFRHSIAAIEEAGREARKGEALRSDNPFTRPSRRQVSMLTPDLRELLVNAWWRGWHEQNAPDPR